MSKKLVKRLESEGQRINFPSLDLLHRIKDIRGRRGIAVAIGFLATKLPFVPPIFVGAPLPAPNPIGNPSLAPDAS